MLTEQNIFYSTSAARWSSQAAHSLLSHKGIVKVANAAPTFVDLAFTLRHFFLGGNSSEALPSTH